MEATRNPSQFGAGLRSEIERRHVHARDDLRGELSCAEDELVELRAEVGQLRSEAFELADRLVDEAAAHVVARQEVGRLEAVLAERSGSVPDDPTDHVVLLPSPAGYALGVLPGPPPAIGARVDVDGMRLAVSRIGRSPLPGDRRRCAFFEAL